MRQLLESTNSDMPGQILDHGQSRSNAVCGKVQHHFTSTSGESYKGIPIYAEPGLHEAIFNAISVYLPPSKVLELGAGAGAFAMRLADHGYDVIASDLDSGRFHVDLPFRVADLGLHFSNKFMDVSFDAVIAVEVIEHLENPLHFLRETSTLLNEGNSLWISFPNIYLFTAIRDFIRKGAFVHWSPRQYWETGHQTILTDWLFEAHCEKCGLAVKRKIFCNPLDFKRVYPTITKRSVAKLMAFVASWLSPLPMEARLCESILFEVTRKAID